MIVIVMTAVGRALMDRHDVRKRSVEKPVERGEDLLQDIGEIAFFTSGEVGESLYVTDRRDVNLERITSEKRNVCRERIVPGNQPLLEIDLLLQDIAQETPPGLVHVLAALLELFCDDGRNERIRVDLTVRVVQRHTDSLALVLENKNVLYEIMLRELFEAVAPDPH